MSKSFSVEPSHNPKRGAPPKERKERRKKWAPRSRSGCITCRNRRVKCDEAKPICGRCSALSLSCTGVAYTHLSSPSTTPPATSSVTTLAARRPLYTLPAAKRAPQLYGSASIKELTSILPHISSLLRLDLPHNPASASQGQLLVRCSHLATYIEFLPSRSGHSLTLDSAIHCLVAALRDLALPAAQRNPIKTLASYSRALKHLQGSLSHSKERLSSETLCATQLLGIFEGLKNDGGNISAAHIQGTSQLLQLRGPSSFSTPFDATMLASEAPTISAQSIFKGQPCFLDQEKWLKALDLVPILRPNEFSCSEFRISRLQLMIRTSRVCCNCDDIITNPASRSNYELRAALLKDVDALREGFHEWFQRWHDIVHSPLEQEGTTQLGRGDSLYERQGSVAAARVYTVQCNRMHVALAGPRALALEMASKEIVDGFSPALASQGDGSSKFNAAMSEVVHYAFYTTTEDWQAYAQGNPDEPIQPHLWRTWLALCGVAPNGNS